MSVDLELLELKNGKHRSAQDGVCLMEAVALFAGEPHSDQPSCACPVLTRFGIGLNDRMGDAQRQRLKALIPRLVGTRDKSLEQRRADFLADRAVRLFLPAALRHAADALEGASLEEHAINLRQHAAHLEALPAAAKAAWAAAWAASEDVWGLAIEVFEQAIALGEVAA